MTDSGINRHFRELRRRINKRLLESGIYSPYRHKQIHEYTWLYGALGCTASDVMFICENPSLTGVERANISPPTEPADSEAQWWGGKARLFREILREYKFKTGEVHTPGGWRCYITNVVKAMDQVACFNQLGVCKRKKIVREWADILRWEVSQVQPKVVFCVGRKAERAVRLLCGEDRIAFDAPWQYVLHYSARGSREAVRSTIREGIKTGLKRAGLA